MQTHAKSLNERFRTLISLIFGLAIGCSLLFGESRWETSPLIEESLMLLACFMAGIGAFGRIWCSLYIAGYKNNVLVTDGPYSMCRNPLYFFSFVGSIGVSCATETFTIPLLTALAFGIYYPSVIRKEQERLTALSETPTGTIAGTFLLHSSLSRLKPPPTAYSVNPATFTHNIVDALWFIWFIGIFEFISGLHEAGMLPVWFLIP
ncbi:MAG: methyltransferase family protein [Akkermansia muciniphila]